MPELSGLRGLGEDRKRADEAVPAFGGDSVSELIRAKLLKCLGATSDRAEAVEALLRAFDITDKKGTLQTPFFYLRPDAVSGAVEIWNDIEGGGITAIFYEDNPGLAESRACHCAEWLNAKKGR